MKRYQTRSTTLKQQSKIEKPMSTSELKEELEKEEDEPIKMEEVAVKKEEIEVVETNEPQMPVVGNSYVSIEKIPNIFTICDSSLTEPTTQTFNPRKRRLNFIIPSDRNKMAKVSTGQEGNAMKLGTRIERLDETLKISDMMYSTLEEDIKTGRQYWTAVSPYFCCIDSRWLEVLNSHNEEAKVKRQVAATPEEGPHYIWRWAMDDVINWKNVAKRRIYGEVNEEDETPDDIINDVKEEYYDMYRNEERDLALSTAKLRCEKEKGKVMKYHKTNFSDHLYKLMKTDKEADEMSYSTIDEELELRLSQLPKVKEENNKLVRNLKRAVKKNLAGEAWRLEVLKYQKSGYTEVIKEQLNDLVENHLVDSVEEVIGVDGDWYLVTVDEGEGIRVMWIKVEDLYQILSARIKTTESKYDLILPETTIEADQKPIGGMGKGKLEDKKVGTAVLQNSIKPNRSDRSDIYRMHQEIQSIKYKTGPFCHYCRRHWENVPEGAMAMCNSSLKNIENITTETAWVKYICDSKMLTHASPRTPNVVYNNPGFTTDSHFRRRIIPKSQNEYLLPQYTQYSKEMWFSGDMMRTPPTPSTLPDSPVSDEYKMRNGTLGQNYVCLTPNKSNGCDDVKEESDMKGRKRYSPCDETYGDSDVVKYRQYTKAYLPRNCYRVFCLDCLISNYGWQMDSCFSSDGRAMMECPYCYGNSHCASHCTCDRCTRLEKIKRLKDYYVSLGGEEVEQLGVLEPPGMEVIWNDFMNTKYCQMSSLSHSVIREEASQGFNGHWFWWRHKVKQEAQKYANSISEGRTIKAELLMRGINVMNELRQRSNHTTASKLKRILLKLVKCCSMLMSLVENSDIGSESSKDDSDSVKLEAGEMDKIMQLLKNELRCRGRIRPRPRVVAGNLRKSKVTKVTSSETRTKREVKRARSKIATKAIKSDETRHKGAEKSKMENEGFSKMNEEMDVKWEIVNGSDIFSTLSILGKEEIPRVYISLPPLNSNSVIGAHVDRWSDLGHVYKLNLPEAMLDKKIHEYSANEISSKVDSKPSSIAEKDCYRNIPMLSRLRAKAMLDIKYHHMSVMMESLRQEILSSHWPANESVERLKAVGEISWDIASKKFPSSTQAQAVRRAEFLKDLESGTFSRNEFKSSVLDQDERIAISSATLPSARGFFKRPPWNLRFQYRENSYQLADTIDGSPLDLDKVPPILWHENKAVNLNGPLTSKPGI